MTDQHHAQHAATFRSKDDVRSPGFSRPDRRRQRRSSDTRKTRRSSARATSPTSVFFIQKGKVKITVLVRARQGSGGRDFRGRTVLRRSMSRGGGTAHRDQPGHGRLPDHVDHEDRDARGAQRGAEVFRIFHRLSAVPKQPDRRRPDRPAVQFQRKTAGAPAAAAGEFRRGRRRRSRSRSRSARKPWRK